MNPITKSAALLLSLLALVPWALPPASSAVPDGQIASLAPETGHCCCGPAHVDEEGCDCSSQQGGTGGGSPATPAPVPVRTALSCQVRMLVAVLGPGDSSSDTRETTLATRPRGEPPPRLAHSVFTL